MVDWKKMVKSWSWARLIGVVLVVVFLQLFFMVYNGSRSRGPTTFERYPTVHPKMTEIGDDGELNREEPIGTNITVLFWNGFWLWPMMGMGAGNEGFVSAGCKMRNCYITTNRAYHRSAHAVILHGIDQGFFPAMEKFKGNWTTPDGPVYILVDKEPPDKNKDNFFQKNPGFSTMFHMLYTYKQDSEVPFKYASLVPKSLKDGTDRLGFMEGDHGPEMWRATPFDSSSIPENILSKNREDKTKDILWMVSHCDAPNKRSEYVERLQRHLKTLKVDILGKCGNDTLPKANDESKELAPVLDQRDKLYEDMLKPYKFYLSFEQSSCSEYISEKLFNVLRTQSAIPVALGGKSRADYERVAPPHSYIHVEDFDNVQGLADQLEYLATNTTAYNEYFWWTEHYEVPSTWQHYLSAQCLLCQRLNSILKDKVSAKYDPRPVNKDMRTYFSSKLECRNDVRIP